MTYTRPIEDAEDDMLVDQEFIAILKQYVTPRRYYALDDPYWSLCERAKTSSPTEVRPA